MHTNVISQIDKNSYLYKNKKHVYKCRHADNICHKVAWKRHLYAIICKRVDTCYL